MGDFTTKPRVLLISAIAILVGTAGAITGLVLLLRRSILTEKIARRGHHLLREYRVDPFALATVSEVMTHEVQSLPASMTLEQTLSFLADPATRHPSFPVVNEERRVPGVIDPPLVQSWLRAGKPPESLVGTTVPLAHPDEYLEGVLTRMLKANGAHVPVVSRADSRPVGYLSWRDPLRAWEQAQQQEVRRTLFYRFGRGANRQAASTGSEHAGET